MQRVASLNVAEADLDGLRLGRREHKLAIELGVELFLLNPYARRFCADAKTTPTSSMPIY